VGAASEALLAHHLQPQVRIEVREGAVSGAYGKRDPCELVLVDEAEPDYRLGEVRPAVDEDRPGVIARL
jgi:hypothetical protein